MQVGQLSCLDTTGELPDTNQKIEAWCSVVPTLLVWGSVLPHPLSVSAAESCRKVAGRYETRLRREWQHMQPIAISGTR